ncbi:hypothetical protein C4578_00440 [Candidatus Microgenomates bacterium]|jgi:hypothetical protein|nr:MAG: hypothetical protein C4578_00440 [Candidatus Microgenomates bacterium]
MKKFLVSAIILTFFIFLAPNLFVISTQSQAQEHVLEVKGEFSQEYSEENTNQFGIHILDPSDLDKARELVNSTGGDWGWVTIVIRDNDLNYQKWQEFFDQCREKHLIPIVRIATHNVDSYWVKPEEQDAEKWADFLSSLNWPTEKKHVIIFNEPNHAKEWGNNINPQEYARILNSFAFSLKERSKNFMIMNAGLDLAAPNSKETMEAYRFMEEMRKEVPDIFEKIDAWSSHSYPNHGFVGKPWESGKTSIRGYEWELSVLKNNFGVKKDLSVFITETGWPKSESKYVWQRTKYGLRKVAVSKYYDSNTAAEYLKKAFEEVWLKDKRVKAITPFVLNYPNELFESFSWFDKEGKPYPQYEIIKSMVKDRWWPSQETKYEIESIYLPSFMPVKTKFSGKMKIKNVGQSIWGDREILSVVSHNTGDLVISDLMLGTTKVKPGETIEVEFTIESATKSGRFKIGWEKMPEFELRVMPPSILTAAKYNLWESFFLKIKYFFLK